MFSRARFVGLFVTIFCVFSVSFRIECSLLKRNGSRCAIFQTNSENGGINSKLISFDWEFHNLTLLIENISNIHSSKFVMFKRFRVFYKILFRSHFEFLERIISIWKAIPGFLVSQNYPIVIMLTLNIHFDKINETQLSCFIWLDFVVAFHILKIVIAQKYRIMLPNLFSFSLSLLRSLSLSLYWLGCDRIQ